MIGISILLPISVKEILDFKKISACKTLRTNLKSYEKQS